MKLSTLSIIVLSTFVAAAMADQARLGDQSCQRYEWRASTFSLSSQHQAALDIAPDGHIITVWSSRRQQSGRAGVYAQIFDRDGIAVGPETALGLWTQAHQTAPVIAHDARGGLWAVWQSHGQDGDAGAIIARHLDAELKGGSEILVNQTTKGQQTAPAVATLPDGGAIVVWMTAQASEQHSHLRGRILSADNQPLEDEFAIPSPKKRSEMLPSVACAADGTFTVAYSIFNGQMDPAGIRMQRFDRAGKRLGDEISVSGAPRASQIEPVIAASGDGFIVAWLDAESDGNDYGVLARRFDQQGRPLCEPFVVNTQRTGTQNGAAIAIDADGRFAIAWNSPDGDDAGICAQLFTADGTRLGTEFRINGRTDGIQAMQAPRGTRRLAFTQRGELVCVWSGDANLGDKSSVNVTMLAPKPLNLAGRQQGVTGKLPTAGVVRPAGQAAEPHRPPTFEGRPTVRAEREIRDGERFGFTAITNTGWAPPDPHMAVGPNHIVAMANGEIAFFTKDGTRTFVDLIEGSDGFWGSLGTTDFVFDPEVLYDELSGRFFAMAAEAWAPPSSSRSYVLVAVSDDSDPNGTWYKYRFDTTDMAGNMFDSPNIGVDEDVVYITGDGFGYSDVYALYTFDKASLLAGDPPAIERSMAIPSSALSAGIPPVSFDSPPAYYMIEHREGGTNTSVRLLALTDPLGTPTITDYSLTVPAYTAPENPPSKGTSTHIITFDQRFWSAAYRNGSLWATHHVGSSRVRVRWYEIAMNGWPESGQVPELVQQGEIAPGSVSRTYFSSISVNEYGDAAITFARSSAQEYISMSTAYRLASDPLGEFRWPQLQRMSTGPYTGDRWGDYSAIMPDPEDPKTFWAHHEYSQSSWRTWIATIAIPPGIGDMNCDGVVDFDDIDPFVLALSGEAGYLAAYPDCVWLNADCNNDGVVDFDDIDAFVALIGS